MYQITENLNKKLLSKNEIESYVEKYFEGKKGMPVDHIQAMCQFLCSEKIYDLTKTPYLLEISCYILSGQGAQWVDVETLARISKGDFFNEILYSIFCEYLKKKVALTCLQLSKTEVDLIQREYCHIFDTQIYLHATAELGLIQYYAFQLVLGMSSLAAEQSTSGYWSRYSFKIKENFIAQLLLLNLKIKETKISQLSLRESFLLTGLFEEQKESINFKSCILVDYFAAQYLMSCLMGESHPDLGLPFAHVWESQQSIQHYVRSLRENPSTCKIFELIINNLRHLNNKEIAKKCLNSIGEVYIVPQTYKYLSQELTGLSVGYQFELMREPNQIKIACKKSTDTDRKTFVKLVNLQSLLKIAITNNNVQDIKLNDFEDDDELIVTSEDPFNLNIVAAILKDAAGERLMHVSSLHPFFTGAGLKSQNIENSIEDNEAKINCVIS